MNDLEQRLKDMLEGDATKAPTVQRAPSQLRPKVRRRQIGTAMVGSLTVLALVAISIAGFRALDGTGPNEPPLPADDPWTGYQVFERTAMVGPFTITSPSDWYLVDQWPLTQWLAQQGGVTCKASTEVGPAGASGQGASGSVGEDCETVAPFEGSLETIPIFRLSTRDPGLDVPICGFGGPEPDLAGDATALQISIERSLIRSPDDYGAQWPVTINASTPLTDGPCGEGRYARFSYADVPYFAWVGSGPDARGDDLARAFDTFSSMTIAGHPQDPVGVDTAAYVIAGGENAAGPWRLELRPSSTETPSSNVELRLASPERFVIQGGTGAGDFTVPDIPIEQAGGDPVFGAVTKEATSVVLRQESRLSPIPAQLIPLPPSLPFDFDLFVARNEMDAPAKAVALGPNGEQLGSGEAIAPATPTPHQDGSPTSNELAWENDGGNVTATGRFLGSSWRVEQLDFRDGLRSDIDGDIRSLDQPALGEPIVLSFPASRYQALLLVLTNLKVNRIEVTSEGSWIGRWMPSTTVDGQEARLWIVELPGAGIGSLNVDGTNVGDVQWP